MLEHACHPMMTQSMLAMDPLAWLTNAGYILLVVLGFSIVIFFHELGHFLAAKWADVRVDKFAIGFGKELVGFTWGETRYSFNVLPLGGYVKMLGQEDFAVDKSGEISVKEDPRSFLHKPVGKRMVIVSAGVIMNVIFAALLFMAIFMIGHETLSPNVGIVVPDSPAHLAGVRTGDRIVKINDREIADFTDIKLSIVLAQPYEPMRIELDRNGEIVVANVVPEINDREGELSIGISPGFDNRVAAIADSVNVPGKPALQPNDIIVEAGGREIGEHDFANVWGAMLEGQGHPVELKVQRPVDETKPTGETEETIAYIHAPVTFLPQVPQDPSTATLLGLVPRTRVLTVDPESPGEEAGVLPGDVIVKWGDVVAPTSEEITDRIADSGDREVPLVVLRDGKKIDLEIRAKKTGLWWKKREPRVGISFQGIEEAAVDRDGVSGLVIAKVVDRIQGKRTPADDLLLPAASGGGDKPIERGALLISAADTPLDSWQTLIDVFKAEAREAANAGEAFANVPVAYRNPDSDTSYTRTFRVPVSMTTATDLNPGSWITEIAGQRFVDIEVGDGKTKVRRPVMVMYWQAAAEILSQHVGETVEIKYQNWGDPTEKSASFHVTENTTDPWAMRISYINTMLSIQPYPTTEMLRTNNPLLAMWFGVKKTGYLIVSFYNTFRRMVIDQTVGIDKISGPVGIVKTGVSIAEAGFVQLMYFMAIISANLAVINFLPLPIVDGGLMVFLIIEKIKGSPISLKTQVATQIVGLALIIAIFLFVTIMDISKLATG